MKRIYVVSNISGSSRRMITGLSKRKNISYFRDEK
jgi:hypothetical protein